MSDKLNIPEIKRVQAASVQPGDVIVVTVARELRYEDSRRIEHFVNRLFPDCPVIVLEKGMSIEVKRPA